MITYQRDFSDLATDDQPDSVSLPKDPDITAQYEGDEQIVVFDAKYRLDSEARKKLGESSSADPKLDEVDRMHVYRDAIRIGADRRPYVLVAYVVYPGSESEPKPYDRARLSAIPSRPGMPLDTITDRFVKMLKRRDAAIVSKAAQNRLSDTEWPPQQTILANS